jgi:F-type H+-transporting ATPase subunit b
MRSKVVEKLGINWGLLIAQLFNVIFLVWLLSQFLFKPILNMLNERTRRVEDSLKDADQVKQQLANAKRDYDAEIAKARQEAAGIVAQAQERAKAQEAEIIAQARRDADKAREDARAQALQERDQLLRDAKDQIADLVTLTASRVLGAELQAKGHDQLIAESLAALERRN